MVGWMGHNYGGDKGMAVVEPVTAEEIIKVLGMSWVDVT